MREDNPQARFTVYRNDKSVPSIRDILYKKNRMYYFKLFLHYSKRVLKLGEKNFKNKEGCQCLIGSFKMLIDKTLLCFDVRHLKLPQRKAS
jgi:hypothetical protein